MPGAVGPGFRPSGGANAKPPAAALLTGQVARELASTLKRLRLVRSSLAMALAGQLLHPRSSQCCGEGAGSLLSQTGWSSFSSFRVGSVRQIAAH